MSRESLPNRHGADQHNQLIDKLLDLIDFAKATGDPMTLSLLKMALLREVEIVSEMSDSDGH